MIAQNASRLGTPFLELVAAEIEHALPDLDAPDAVFIGGGLSTGTLVDTVWNRLRDRGRLVANVVTLEGERALLDAHARYGGDMARIAVSHADPVGGLTGGPPCRSPSGRSRNHERDQDRNRHRDRCRPR